MADPEKLVDFNLINEMLYGDLNYVKEFSAASITSVTEFKNGFRTHLMNRDMEELRRAGHKIKPVAQMLHLDPIVDNYEKSKQLLQENAPEKKLNELINKMDTYCGKVIAEFHELTQALDSE